MTAENLIHYSPAEIQIQQAEAEFGQAKSKYELLYRQADTFQAELRALKAFLQEPADDMTVGELKIIEQRKEILEMELDIKGRELEVAYKRIKTSQTKIAELAADMKTDKTVS